MLSKWKPSVKLNVLVYALIVPVMILWEEVRKVHHEHFSIRLKWLLLIKITIQMLVSRSGWHGCENVILFVIWNQHRVIKSIIFHFLSAQNSLLLTINLVLPLKHIVQMIRCIHFHLNVKSNGIFHSLVLCKNGIWNHLNVCNSHGYCHNIKLL